MKGPGDITERGSELSESQSGGADRSTIEWPPDAFDLSLKLDDRFALFRRFVSTQISDRAVRERALRGFNRSQSYLPRPARVMVEEYLHANAMQFAFWLLYLTLGDDEAFECVTVDGLPQLEGAYASGKGVVVATLHLGAHGVVATHLARLGYPVTVAAGSSFAAQLLRDAASASPWSARQNNLFRTLTALPTADTVALVRFFQTLKRGGIVVIYADAIRRLRGSPVTLFGEVLAPPTEIRDLQDRTGCVVLAASAGPVLMNDGAPRSTLRIDGLRPSNESIDAALVRWVESEVQRSPASWTLWGRWPPEESGF